MAESDPLLLLREAIARGIAPILSKQVDLVDGASELSIVDSTHLIFPQGGGRQPIPIALSSETRFKSPSAGFVKLQGIYFAWVNRDLSITEYFKQCDQLGLQRLPFIERTDLITYLEGADSSEYVVGQSAELGKPAATGAKAQDVHVVKQISPRLREIYAQERTIGEKYGILHGARPIDFNYVLKLTTQFNVGRTTRTKEEGSQIHPSRMGQVPRPTGPNSSNPTQATSRSGRPKDPIILLSPSTSSTIRMSNAKSLLEQGVFTPPAHSASSDTSILHVSRVLKNIHPTNPIRFILVDTTENFKPDYWDRVVAVFTTGQTWQFKQYKWVEPQQLFSKVKGFYVGYDKDVVPKEVKLWGGVQTIGVDKDKRWRDREIVEIIWDGIEQAMLKRGWGR